MLLLFVTLESSWKAGEAALLTPSSAAGSTASCGYITAFAELRDVAAKLSRLDATEDASSLAGSSLSQLLVAGDVDADAAKLVMLLEYRKARRCPPTASLFGKVVAQRA